jgi:hypothetical protein
VEKRKHHDGESSEDESDQGDGPEPPADDGNREGRSNASGSQQAEEDSDAAEDEVWNVRHCIPSVLGMSVHFVCRVTGHASDYAKNSR